MSQGLRTLFQHTRRRELMPAYSQNHQYALTLQDPFPAGWEPFFINCNDSSVEGIKSTADSGRKVWGVQFHPESAGGPLDTIEVRYAFTSL
jgi:carbamoyl-phosphate synthase small subunit